MSKLDYKEADLKVHTSKGIYWYNTDKDTLIEEINGKQNELGCGKIILKSSFKKATAKQQAYIEITAELTIDNQKDYEVISFSPNEKENEKLISDFMARYVTKPFKYLENVIGVEINFNKVFYQPEKLKEVNIIVSNLSKLENELHKLENELAL